MPRTLITGAGRGLGLEFARQYRAAGWDVVATCRQLAAAASLRALGCETDVLDVTDAGAIDSVAAKIPPGSLDLLVLNAGTAGRRTPVLQTTEPGDFDAVMRTNVFGPMRLVAALADRVADGGRIAVISSRMGSIGEMSNGNSVLYRASKAAVNAIARAAAIELAARGVTVVVLHPGWVKTDMGGPQADIDVATSVAGMRATILRAGATGGAHFYDYQGQAVAW
jgi:NAD(P)-dependent dehydrogenase (short-subunit alcohol dehydrogenase family)